MNKTILAVTVAACVGMAGCSSTEKVGNGPGAPLLSPGTQQAISEQRVVNDFKREGIRVIFSVTGGLEAIEAVGYAPVWGNSQNALRESYRVAELEAKKAMNDFINRETITSSTSVAMISKNLERARDNKTNNFSTNRGRDEVASVASDEDFDSVPGSGAENTSEQNTATRRDAVNIASRVKTDIQIRNTGILGGLRLVEGSVVNDGRTVRVVYRWDKNHAEARVNVRNLMMK